ncbi:DUF4021 domain-containing protein [Bacillus paramycoides]|uniref:DUF4021 domain-containing protein n=1 Tax=Bacillus paramycoides TaxID=2026194 RepID=A0A1J9UBV5_9BACI|nr:MULTISPECIES: DUF4021 domain-containing protein [Bacillus]MED0973192.1 DUF4021 domain-containing protein [Bacillus paramycoides]MED1408516.1 DUF4021 domain-containing protein [Bacillus paramycoides]MED1466090.1 DUF4021 domain-containing protein [Bacillus paramycoides]MED1495803.1 DUF4021 domain-containing protein [Bacillus paramycoides]MED1557507.1 DUF4021 domain-containing protein [Bacillus paramycoides]
MNDKNANQKANVIKNTTSIQNNNTVNLNVEVQAMNGLYGMSETTIEDVDYAVTDDLTSKNN